MATSSLFIIWVRELLLINSSFHCLDSDFVRGDPRVHCRQDCHQGHTYGMPKGYRDNEDSVNDYPQEGGKPRYDDSFSVLPAGFFFSNGRCYYSDEVASRLGGHRFMDHETPVYNVNIAGANSRGYSDPRSRKRYQKFTRSCTRGVIPFSLTVSGTDRPVVDTDGDVHRTDIRPSMAIDQFCRYITLDFVKVRIGDCNDDLGTTELHVKLIKGGSNGYQMTYEGSRGSRWHVPYDSLDSVRNCNLYIKEDFAQKKECLAARRKYRLEHSRVSDDGKRYFYQDDTRLGLDDNGFVITGIDPLAGCFTPNAYWAGTTDLVSEQDLPPNYFSDDVGVVTVGSDRSTETNSISCVNGDSTGMTTMTFSDVSVHASGICGPLYDHIFTRKLDLIDDLEIFLRNRQFLSKEAAKMILRSSRFSKRTHWTHFDECFNISPDWSSVCGPIRTFIERGGDLADTDAVDKILDGADVDRKRRLLSRVREFKLRFRQDFKMSQGLFYLFISVFITLSFRCLCPVPVW